MCVPAKMWIFTAMCLARNRFTFNGTLPTTARCHGWDTRSSNDLVANLSDLYYFFLSSVVVQGNYLRFTSIAPYDAGRYYCTAANPYGNVTKTAEVIVTRNEVTDSTVVGQANRLYDVNEGGSVRLDCIKPLSGSSSDGYLVSNDYLYSFCTLSHMHFPNYTFSGEA